MSDNLRWTEYNTTEEKWSPVIVVAVLVIYSGSFRIVDICHYFE